MNVDKSVFGTFLIFLSIFPACFISVLVVLGSSLTNPQKAFVRFSAGIFFLIIMFFCGKFKLKFNNKLLLLARGVFGCTAIIIMFVSLNTLGIGKGTTVYYTYPIFACITARIILKEKLSLSKWIAVLVAFVGIACIYIKSANDFYSFFYVNRYVLLDLIGAFCGGLTVTIIKKCHDNDSVFSIFCAQSVVGVILFSFSIKGFTTMNFSFLDVFIIIGIGIASVISQVTRTWGYKYTDVKNGAAVCMLIPVVNVIIGIYFFKEHIYFDEIIGAVLIITSCLFILLKDSNKNRMQKQRT